MNDKSETVRGLTVEEVLMRAANNKTNALSASPGRSVGQIVCANLLTFFNFLNLAIAVILTLVGSYRNTLFMGVVFCNVIIGLVQELRAKKMVDRLSILSQGKITVYRTDSKTLKEYCTVMPADILVEDDKIALHAGDEVPADACVLSGFAEVNESLLTGEAIPVAKKAGDKLLSGSFVVSGSCDAVLTAVGNDSFAAKLTVEAKRQKNTISRLMTDIKRIVRTVGIAVVPIGLILFCKSYFALQENFADSVVSAAASMIGMIPEGLMLLTSIALALGVIRLGQKKVLVQEIYCTENLARVDVLCLDKTGTLTSCELAVIKVIPMIHSASLRQLMSDHLAAVPDSGATYSALAAYFNEPTERKPLAALPFSSERKFSKVTFEDGVYRLGAPEYLINGVNETAEEYQNAGYRVLAFAKEERLLALVVLADKLRDNAKEVCSYFEAQDITLKIISGDHPKTASAIAKAAGIKDAQKHLDCHGISDERLAAAAEEYTVFGRVMPYQKKTLVKALQENRHTVAMTGDGVNDILAMKQADCSISFGSGADAARKASQLVLLDSDFSALPQVLLQGRRVIGNITRSASLFLFKTCFSALLSLILVFLPYSYPFAPINLTLISSLLIGIPSFFLALEPNYGRIKDGFLTTVAGRALPGGITAVILLLGIMILGDMLGYSDELIRSLSTFSTALVAFVNLAAICRPFRKWHLALIFGMAGLFVAAVLVIPEVFMLLDLSAVIRQAGVMILGILAAVLPLYEGLRRVMNLLFYKILSHKGKEGLH